MLTKRMTFKKCTHKERRTMTNSKCKLGNRGERGEHSFHSMVNNDLVNMPIISFITARYAHSKYTCSMCNTFTTATCVPFSAYLHNEEDIDGFQMPIKHPTSRGQVHDQEVAVQWTFHLVRSSFLYLSALMLRTQCSTYFCISLATFIGSWCHRSGNFHVLKNNLCEKFLWC